MHIVVYLVLWLKLTSTLISVPLHFLSFGIILCSLTIGAFLGESQVAQDLEELQSQHPAVDIGSYPFFREAGYGTNLVVRGTDAEELASIGEALKVLIENHGAEPHEGGV